MNNFNLHFIFFKKIVSYLGLFKLMNNSLTLSNIASLARVWLVYKRTKPKQREDKKEEKEEKKREITLKASQESSNDKSLIDLSEEDKEFAILIRGFKKFLRRKNLANFKENKKSESKKRREVTCYKSKKPGHIKNECPRLKHKSKRAKEKRNGFKAT